MDPDSELFRRFRRTGEPAALARVFDRVAPDLLRIAQHTCGNVVDAEDIVQATFVAAIECADSWDERRGLFPWLVGILVRQAGTLRRARCVPDPARLVQRRAEDPGRVAEGAEFDDSVTAAVARLDEPYRPVVHLHLRHGLSGKEIAAALDRPHARVRQQLVRGLQRLRGLLPSGLCVFAAASLAGRGLAAVRGAVLAEVKGRAVGAAAAGGVMTLGGVLVWKGLVAVAAVAVLGLLVWQVSLRDGPVLPLVQTGEASATTGDLVDAHGLPSTVVVAADGERVAAAELRGSLRFHTRSGILQPAVLRRMGDHRYEGRLVGVAIELWRGESDTRPRTGVRLLRTGDHGEVLAPDLAVGAWTFDLVGRSSPLRVSVEAGRETSVDLPLVVDGFASGRVVDADGAPVAGASILVSRSMQEFDYFWGRGDRRAVAPDHLQRCAAHSDGAGRFVVFALDGELCVAADAPGFVPSLPQPTWASAPREVMLVLERADGSLDGTVRDQQGRPVSDALVSVGSVSRDHQWRADGALLMPRQPQLTRTDARGAFTFESLAAGSYTVHAGSAGCLPAVEGIDVVAGSRQQLALTLAAGLEIRGRVVGESGAAMAGLTVRAQGIGVIAGRAGRATTAPDGGFELEHLPVGQYAVRVEAGARCLAERALDGNGPGSVSCGFTVPDGGVLRGRIVDHEGRGLERWRIVASDQNGDHAVGSFALPITREQGRFELLRWFPVECRLTVHAPEGSMVDPEATFDVDAGVDEVELVVPPHRLGSVRGRLLAAGGAPLGACEVFLIGPGGSNRRPTAATGSDGTLLFEHVPPAVYELRYHDRDAERRLPFTLARGEHRDLGDVAGSPLARFRIEFVGDDGRPWQGALPDVFVRDDDGAYVDGARYEAIDGGCEGELPAGRYAFVVDGVDLIAAPLDVTLRAGEPQVVEMALRVGRRRELRFGGEGDVAVGDPLHVEVRDEGGAVVVQRSFRRSPHGDGVCTLEHVFAGGDYTVSAHTDAGVRFAGAFTVAVDARQPRRVAIPLVGR